MTQVQATAGPVSTGRRALGLLSSTPARWSLLAACAVWAATVLHAGRGYGSTLVSAGLVAVFLVLVGIGQMFVITAGNGNIDLSISYVMTLGGFVSVRLMDGSNSRILVAVLGVLACGILAGLLNHLTIQTLGVPPIVATLAIGFVLFSISQVLAHEGSYDPSPALVELTSARVLGIPILVVLAVGASVVAALGMHRSSFGRALEAIGQNRTAARLAGLPVSLTTGAAYLISGSLAAVSGLLLAAYSGGAALDLATTYQLGSIAVVVLGGSLIAGGKSTVLGVWGAAMFVTLMITMLNVYRLTAAWQFIIQGVLIVAVLAFAGQRKSAQ